MDETAPTLPPDTPDWSRDADLRLAREAAGSIEPALRALLRRPVDGLRRYAWMRTGDRDAVEDLVVEALARIAQPQVLAHYRGEGPLDAFLARVGRNAINSRLRTRAGRREEAELREEVPEGREGTLSAEDRVMRGTVGPALRAALAGLSERDREVVLMISLFDFSYQETAEALGMKLGTVKSSHHRALARLRDELADEYPGAAAEGAG